MSRPEFTHRATFASAVCLAATLMIVVQERELNAQEPVSTFDLKVDAGDLDRVNAIVKAEVAIDGLRAGTYVLTDKKSGIEIIGQYDAPPIRKIGAKAEKRLVEKLKTVPAVYGDITFVVPKLAAGESMQLSAKPVDAAKMNDFQWNDNKSSQMQLKHDDTPIAKLMYEKVDDSSTERRAETYKVYHHVYAPGSDVLLTKGPGGLFPHHRGIFFGYNRISYGENSKADVWHCKKGESQISDFSYGSGGQVSGRTSSVISWNGQDGKTFAVELRGVEFIKVGDATVVDFNSDLLSLGSNITLDGDPQHAGVQFRATQVVPDKTKHLTYYLRPDGKAKPGEFRNWSGKNNEKEINTNHINLKWHAVCLALPKSESSDKKKLGKDDVTRYTVCRIGSSSNPEPERFSERDYGRFGAYCPTSVSPKKPLRLTYRFWIQEGEMTVAEIDAIADSYLIPVTTMVSKSGK